MEFLTRGASVRDRIRLWRAAGSRVALVPTAGTLHKGHMSLVAEAQERADHVIVSMVADPGDREAPTVEADRELVQKIGASVLFAPPLQEIYPMGRELAAMVRTAEMTHLWLIGLHKKTRVCLVPIKWTGLRTGNMTQAVTIVRVVRHKCLRA